jgi:hypothetical protein
MAMRRDGGPGRGEFRGGPRGGEAGPNRRPVEELRQEFLKRYDANGDGKLDAAEREAIGRDIEDGKLMPPPPSAPPPPRPPE